VEQSLLAAVEKKKSGFVVVDSAEEQKVLVSKSCSAGSDQKALVSG